MPIVLVHGLWHDPRHLDGVAGRLRAAGLEVTVPELHRGSLSADTAAVQAAVDAMPRPPVVLGHSYGGCVITGLTGVAHLIYLAAYVPDEGESAATLGGSAHFIDRIVRRRPDRATELDPAGAVDALYADCSPAEAARAVALLRPQAAGHGRGVPERVAWHGVASTYVVCTADRAIDPAVQRRMATRCSTTHAWPTGHSPFLSRPDLVAGLITDTVGAVR
jgi:alpha/beta hydrolase family protein